MAEIDNTIASKIKPPSSTGLKEAVATIAALRDTDRRQQAYQQTTAAFPSAEPAAGRVQAAAAPVVAATPVARETRSAFTPADPEADSFARRFYFQ